MKTDNTQKLQSKLLNDNGLLHFIAGSSYNFRYAKIGDAIKDEVAHALDSANIHPDEVYSGTQTHSENIAYCDGDNGEAFIYGRNFPDTDGLITDKAGVALLIKYADCTPIVIYDPIKKVQAIVHSGWRGTLQKISQIAIEKMQTDFKCELKDLVVYMGPTIDQDHYEVGTDVYDAFSEFENRDLFFRPYKEKYQLSMQEANYQILLGCGLREDQIDVCQVSTYTDDRLHSARQSGSEYQLNAMITMIPKNEGA